MELCACLKQRRKIERGVVCVTYSLARCVCVCQVTWEHVDTGEPLSRDEGIVIQYNPMIGGLRKYEVQKRVSGDRQTYMLVVRRLGETDAGIYKCTIHITGVAFDQWPYKLGMITVQGQCTAQRVDLI